MGPRSTPVNAFASALPYQVPGKVAPAKSLQITFEPAEPRTAEFELQDSGSQVARTVIVEVLTSVAPQMLAAC